MATAAPTGSSSKETTNYARLCRLLVDVGNQALRDTFDAIHPPANLHTILTANKTMLQSLRKRKVINATQWGMLFPAIPSSVSSANFDITLLMVLLRNVCSLHPPTTGWDTLPAVTDVSHAADIARVKYYRNTVYGHAECASIDDATFNTYWGDIRDTLVRIGGAKYKVDIDNLETECMDPEVEEHCKELLSQWKKDEENVKAKLDEVIKKLDDLKTSSLPQRKEFAIEGKSTVLEELSEDSAMCKEKGHETEPLDGYCNNCKVSICDRCGETRHIHHTKVNIQQATEEEKLKLEETVEQVKMQIVDLEVEIKTTTELFTVCKEKIAKARKDVGTTVEELIRVLKEHERSILTELDLIEKAQQRDYLTQLEQLQASVRELKGSVRNCEEILHKNVCVETVQAQQAEIERSKGVLTALKLDIYRPCHLCYGADKDYIENLTGKAPGKVLVTKTDPSRSILRWHYGRKFRAGKSTPFDIVTFDSRGWECYYQEIDEIKVTVQTPTGMDLDLKYMFYCRGIYTYYYRPLCDGEHKMTVLVNSQPLSGSPWTLRASPYEYSSFKLFGIARFEEPCAVAIDKRTENLALADRKKQRVQLFNRNLEYLTELGPNGPAAIKLKNITSVAFTHSGDVIVVASGSVICFTISGEFTGCINNKTLNSPFSLTIALDGGMIVCDTGDKSVKVLSPDGTEMLQSFSALDCDNSPWEAICFQDMFFVSYLTAGCVKTFNNDGDFLYDIGNEGEGQLSKPRGLAVDVFGNLIVCDEGNKALNVYKLDGTFVKSIKSHLIGCPCSIAVYPSIQLVQMIVSDLEKKSFIRVL